MGTERTSGQLEVERLRQRNQIIIADLTVCHHCKRPELKADEVFCPNCGFPQKGSESDHRKFIATFNVNQRFQDDYKKSINKARNILFILAGLNLVAGLLMGVLIQTDIAMLISSVILAGIYLGLGLWSRTKPFPAIITGLIVYITIIVISAMIEPMSIVSGIIWKVIIISGFIYGYKGAKEGEEIKEQMELKQNGSASI